VNEAVSTQRQANYALLVLLLAYILSFIDRNAMAVLVGPIRADFDISDFQYSLLHGFAFSMFYIFLGLPIARLADRGSRKSIITIGVFFWSLMTCLCGVAQSFKMLFIARMGVGVGEAALSPPAYSLLSDYFSSEALPRAMAIYTLGITLGGGLAYIVGGGVYEYFLLHGSPVLPLLGELRPWQLTFIVVGLPGFLLVALLSLIHVKVRYPAAQTRSIPTA
jgi:MFS family permease